MAILNDNAAEYATWCEVQVFATTPDTQGGWTVIISDENGFTNDIPSYYGLTRRQMWHGVRCCTAEAQKEEAVRPGGRT